MVMKKRSPRSKKPTARRKAASKSSRKNPSWADVRSAASSAHGAASRTWERAKPHAKRAAASVKSAAERGYAYAKPRAKSAAASARAAAERGYAYAKPRVKAGTRRALTGLSALSARGAKALENPAGNVTAWEVLYDGPGAGPAGDGTYVDRFGSAALAKSFARGRTAYRRGPAIVTKVSVPRRPAERWGPV